jgi:hypothetical protein
MCKRKGSTTSTIWPPSTASGYKRSMVIVVNGFITDLPLANRKNSIFLVVNQLTKMAHFIPCTKAVIGEETTKLFHDNIYRIHGLPNNIVSDTGTQFTSNFCRRLFQLLGVKINLSTAYHS